MKKIIATICVLILATGLLASCGKSKETPQNQVIDPSAPFSSGPTEAPHIGTPPGPPPGSK